MDIIIGDIMYMTINIFLII